MTNASKSNKTRWHRLLGTLLEQLLTPVGISVQCDVKVMVNPPEADILLLRRQTSEWTKAQLERLADGIRDSKASHILVEFKYSESLNEKALQQALSYDYFYKTANHLSEKQVVKIQPRIRLDASNASLNLKPANRKFFSVVLRFE